MGVELLLAPEAEHDISDAYDWYEQRRVGLGEEFLSCVEICLQIVQRSPVLHATIHEDYRRALIRRFPYAVFYEFDGKQVTVYCVFHTSRDPEKWRARLS